MRGLLFILFVLLNASVIYGGCIQGNCLDGYGTFVYPNGDKYVGQFVGGHPEGKGIMYYSDGGKFLGLWRGGRRHGTGKLIAYSGEEHIVNFINGMPRTESSNPSNSATTQQKHMKDNPQRAVVDVQADQNGNSSSLSGGTNHTAVKNCNKTYCNNEVGQYVYKDGSKWVGYFVGGRPSGKGTCYYSNGDRYIGGWKLNAPEGEGVMHFASGKVTGAIWSRGRPIRPQHKKEEIPAIHQIAANRDRAVKIWALVVGVSSYTHMPVLRYSDDDAYRMYAFLKSPEGGAVPDDQIEILVDEDATRTNILRALQELFYQADENDMVLLYYSGHGLQGAFLPIDYDGYQHTISHKEIFSIFEGSKAKYKVCYADACYSGSMTAMKSPSVQSDLIRYYHHLGDADKGVAFLLSSKGEEYSLEDKGLRQGVFTHYLIRGLKGEADTNKNRLITISELYRYVRWGVRKYTGNLQTPVIIGNYDDQMPLAIRR